MNKQMSKLALAIGALVMAGGAMAADTNSTSASVTAEVITPLTIAKDTDLVFGNLVAGNGTVTLPTSGVRTKTGDTPLIVLGSSPTAAKFTVTGQGAQTFAITTTGTSATLTGVGDPMVFTLISESVAGAGAANAVASGAASTGTLLAGKATIYAGGSVVVAANQAAGSYGGSVAISVDYN